MENDVKVADTNGDLTKDMFKSHPSMGATTAWLDNEKSALLVSANNILYSAVPGIKQATYKSYLTYNGTGGYVNKTYSTVVAEDQGVFNISSAPVLKYDSKKVMAVTDPQTISEKVYDMSSFGDCTIVNYQTDCCGGTTTRTISNNSYQRPATTMPNVSNTTVFVDGWYTFTFVLFRNIEQGDKVIKDSFYGFRGFIFKASVSGNMHAEIINVCDGSSSIYYKPGDKLLVDSPCEEDKCVEDSANASHVYILPEGETDTSKSVEQEYNDNYIDVLFDLNNSSGISSHAGTIYAQSQILLTPELNKAIAEEILDQSIDKCAAGCDFADWQALMLKGIGAGVMFDNGLFANAQIILESGRESCSCSETGNC